MEKEDNTLSFLQVCDFCGKKSYLVFDKFKGCDTPDQEGMFCINCRRKYSPFYEEEPYVPEEEFENGKRK